MTGFKSFGDRTVTIKLSSGFTCIVGPNGAGKSNIIDALCFSLGRLSKKTMRAKSLEDLIFAGSRGKNPSNRATVTLYFDNSDGIFPGGTDTFEIMRIIKRGGGGGYKMNGKNTTRQQILNALAAANVDPDGSNQFVLQGKIVELTHMNAEDRRIFIEELIGLQKYDEMKDATMKELEKAERDLGQFEAIFKEVSTQLKKVEKEKNDALAWKELEENINFRKAQLIALKITHLQKEEEELEKKIDETNKIIEELKEKITRQEDMLKQESLIMENIQKTITQKEKEKDEINEKITQLKTDLSSTQTTLNLAKKSIDKLSAEIKSLEEKQMELKEGQTYDKLIEEQNTKISDIESKIEEARKDIEEKQKIQAELEEKISQNEEEKSTLKTNISKLKQNQSSLNAQVKLLKDNIKRNTEKKAKLEEELSNLQGDAENIEEAVKTVKAEEAKVRSKIENINAKINKENQNQKNLESKINEMQVSKNKLSESYANFQSTVSSINTEIMLNEKNKDELVEKRNSIETRIKELSAGKNTEEIVKNLLDEKDDLIENIENLKKQAKQEEDQYKDNESQIELYNMKKNSYESEIVDHNNKSSNLETEIGIIKRDLISLDREKKNLDLQNESLDKDLKSIEAEKGNIEIKLENVNRRLEELQMEKENILTKIESAEEEYQRNADDVTGILQILNMLTQNIGISVESIKGNIQQSNAEAIELSADDLKNFILDIIDIMKTVEGISCDEEQGTEISDSLNSILQTLKMFTDNADSSISQLVNKVKDSVDIAIQDSTSDFDSFVQDLTEILENIHISLKKLALSKSQELYKQFEEISESIKYNDDELNVLKSKTNSNELQEKHLQEKLGNVTRRKEEIDKKVNEITEKINAYQKEIDERTEKINNSKKELIEINNKIEEFKSLKENYWNRVGKIQENIEEIQKNIDLIDDKLKDLRDIQSLFENSKEIKENITRIEESIENKKDELKNTEKQLNEINSQQSSIQQEIDKLSEQKTKFWETMENLRSQIDDENKILEKVISRLKSLENIQRIVNTIEEITIENEEARKKVLDNEKEIEKVNGDIDNIQVNVDELQKVVDTLKIDKKKELAAQNQIQKELSKFNKDLQKAHSTLNEFNKNKEREQKIFSLNEEIKDTESQITQIAEKIEASEELLKQESKRKSIKEGEIESSIKEKDESWRKQKAYQDTISDLKSDLSLQNSKYNNFESKRIITMDQIETLYERSKEFGSLPTVTEDLTEASLQSEIEVATKKKKTLEPVNLKAIEQYDVVKERFDEIDMRRQTIQRERKAILDAIEKIELEKTRTFMKAYHDINREFSRTFQKLSPGGSAKMLLDRPDSPFEGGVSIEARPRGKKISSLEILSGGEKTLVALSFIFAVQEFYPAPFYVMDEIDAALDGPNVHRVSTVIQEFSSQAQFLVISHREENIVNADRIYGVAMQQSGITDIFSVDLEEEAKRLIDTGEDQPSVEGIELE